jgi:ribonuclease HII
MTANASEENKLRSQGYKLIAGVDESGMGSFAGDIYVAVVIFPLGIDFQTLLPGLNDSKLKSPIQREQLYSKIKEHAIDYSIATASVQEIDELNVYWARFQAARSAINSLKEKPDYILMDGNRKIPDVDIPQHAIVKGDQKSISIAAASILAKVDRDKHMVELSKLVHEDYGWDKNKAYYCKQTIASLKKHGKTQWHRQKFVEKYLQET